MHKLTADDPETHSPDLTAENIAALQSLFPEAFTEGKIDFDVLRQLLGGAVDDRGEKYGLNWHGKRAARQAALTPSAGTLRPCPDDSVDWDTTQNLFIEGDNLEVLKLLQKSYAGKVKLIYIDPPYNTGNDFVYPDDYRDSLRNYQEVTGQTEGGRRITTNTEASGRFHTDWLNMMLPRLKLARNVMRQDGLVFVSIDDGELDRLRMLCNEVFGEENFVECFTVRSNPRGNQARKLTASEHEYIVCYARDRTRIAPLGLPLTAEQQAEYRLSDADGLYREIGLRKRGAGSRREDAPNEFYPIYVTSEHEPVTVDKPSGRPFSEVWPKLSDGSDGRWRWSPDTVNRNARQLKARLVRGREGVERWDVFEKDYLQQGEQRKARSILYEKKFNYENASEELKRLMGQKVFDYPKPMELVRHVIEIAGLRDDDTVMDFFAGSGTTGHAVVARNASDGGTRRYILVQLPEPLDPANKDQKVAADFCDQLGKPLNIAELCKERLRRAGTKVKADNPMLSGDTGFRVFKLDYSSIRAWQPDRDDLAGTLLANLDHIRPGRTESDLLYELLLKLGLDLCIPIETRAIAGKRVHSIGAGTLIACLDESITRDQVDPLAIGIVEWHGALNPAGETACVFRDAAFADDVAKTNLAAILQQHGLANVRSL